MGIGKRIISRRSELKMTQYALAKKAGISQSALSTIENEKNGPTASKLQAIATVLECSTDYLIDGIENQTDIEGNMRIKEWDNLLNDLSPFEIQRVRDFVAGLRASRKEDVSV